MPNEETASQKWLTYLTPVDEIEANIDFDFLSTVPAKLQNIKRAKVNVSGAEMPGKEIAAVITNSETENTSPVHAGAVII